MPTYTRMLIRSAIAITALFAGLAHADSRVITLEHGIEASTERAIFPSSVGGAILFTSCPTCLESKLQITAETQLFVGEDSVTLSELKSFVQTGGPYFMMLYHKPADLTLTRVVVSGQLPSQRARAN